MLRKISYYGLLIGTVVFFALFFFYPVFQVLKGGLRDSEGKLTFFYLAEVFRNPIYLEGLLNSVKIAICSTLVAVLISLPLAWLSDRFEFAGKKYLTGALLLPMILAPFVGALGMQCIFGRYGAFNTLLEHFGLFGPGEGPDWFAGGFWGVVIMEALHLFPILYLNIVAAFANVDPMLLEASADLGCTGFRRFRKVMLPLIMPGVFAGGSLVFIWAFTELGTPLMFNFDRSTAVQIYSGINEIGSNPMPYALVLVMMVLSALMYIIAKVCFGRNSYAMMSKAGRATSTVRLTGLKALPVILAFGAIGLFSLLPHLGVLGLAVCNSWYRSVLPTGLTTAHFEAALGHSLTVPSIVNSLRYAVFAVIVALLLGRCALAQVVAHVFFVGHDLVVLAELGHGQLYEPQLGSQRVETLVDETRHLVGLNVFVFEHIGAEHVYQHIADGCGAVGIVVGHGHL